MLVPSVAQAGCNSDTCRERVARKQCSQKDPRACIRRAIYTYELNKSQAAWMMRVARCESGYNPYAENGPCKGLFQFHVGTWAGTPYGRYSVYSAKWNALAAAWMVRRGRQVEWSCK